MEILTPNFSIVHCIIRKKIYHDDMMPVAYAIVECINVVLSVIAVYPLPSVIAVIIFKLQLLLQLFQLQLQL